MFHVERLFFYFNLIFSDSLQVKDFLVSGKVFSIKRSQEYNEVLETFPRPIEKRIGDYYESEDYISHNDSSKSFLDRLYYIAKKINLWNKYRRVSRVKKSFNTVLDIGMGTGDFLSYMKNKGKKITGVEPNIKARNLAINKGIEAFQKIDNVPGKYDVISLWHVLEHVHDLEKYLLFFKDTLDKNGVLIIAVPNFNSFDAKYYKSFWAAYDVPRHLWHFSKTGIRQVFQEKGFKCVSTQPLILDSIYVSILSEKYKGSKFHIIRGLIVGIISNILGLFSKEYSSHIYFFKLEE